MERNKLYNTKKHIIISIMPNFKIKLPKASKISVKNYNGTKVVTVLCKNLKIVYSNTSQVMFFNLKQH